MKAKGDAAEELALAYLLEQGLTLVARNYRSRFGEIDLILRDAATIVFVEVRLRGRAAFTTALESVTAEKQQRIRLAAQHYLAGRSRPPPCRFDVIVLERLATESIQWIRDAFGDA